MRKYDDFFNDIENMDEINYERRVYSRPVKKETVLRDKKKS